MGTTFKKGLAPSGGQRKGGSKHGSGSSFSVELQLDLGPATDRHYGGVPRLLPGPSAHSSVEVPFEVAGRLSPPQVHRNCDGSNGPLCSSFAWD